MNKIYLLLTLFIFASINISAQTSEPTPKLDVKTIKSGTSVVQEIGSGSLNGKTVSGGVLNSKASILSKPKYPAAARAVKASGAVSVQVLIDEQGNVASASAVSGHPLLRQAAEQAALSSKFSPTTLQGQPVKVAGIITYNFVTDMSFTQIGFDLSLIEKSKEFPRSVFVGNISANIPNDWEKERSNLYLLDAITREPVIMKPELDGIGIGTSAPLRAENYSANPSASTVKGVVKGEPVDRVKLAEELQNDIESRLATEKVTLWKFQIGKALGRIAAQAEDEAKIKAEASNLNELISNAPSEVSSTLESLQKFVQLIQTNDSTSERTAEIKSMATKLRNF